MLSQSFLDITASNKFSTSLNQIFSELKDKKIIIYGAGEGFSYLSKKYSFFDLNIIAIADIKFEKENIFDNLKAISPETIPNYDFDRILVTNECSKPILNYLTNELRIKTEKIITIFDDSLTNNIYDISGKYNNIVIIDNEEKNNLNIYDKIEGLDIIIDGNYNTIIIEKPYKFTNSSIKIYNYNHATLHIKSESEIVDSEIIIADGNHQIFNIGKHFTVYGTDIITGGENNTVTIGEDCLFARGTFIRNDDGHSILDSITGEILNYPAQTFSIGDHCWLCRNVIVTKNATLPNNTIVGAGSIVTKKFTQEGTILAGNPANIIKRNVTWDRKNPNLLEETRKSELIYNHI